MENTAEQREKLGKRAGITGLICNMVLSGIKIAIGVMTGAVSVMGDAVNNLSDSLSSIITLLGFKLSGKKSDETHPYGHGRFEYFAGLFISVGVIAVAINLLITSVQKIINVSDINVSVTEIIILSLTIGVKLGMGIFYSRVAKKIKSSAMKAAASDSFSDCLTTSVALASIILVRFFNINIDGYCGAAVSLVVIFNGYRSAKETIDLLLGEAPSKEVLNELIATAKENEEVLGVHDLRVHDYGPGREFASMHIEVSADMSLVDSHNLVDKIEHEIVKKGLVREMTIHCDPLILDEQNSRLRDRVKDLVEKIDKTFTVHDIRYRGSALVFEVVIPFECKRTKEEVDKAVREAVRADFGDIEADIYVDRGDFEAISC
ncbi:MAG: cation transporter [Clostridiales bacterium]|nr:cation transporter [Clostridiales bacterium]